MSRSNPGIPCQRGEPVRRESLELRCIVVGQVQALNDLGAALEAQLERVHVRLKLETLTVEEFTRRVGSGDFELALASMTMGHGGAIWPYAIWRSRTERPLLETDQASVFAFGDRWALKGFRPCAGR